MESLPSKSTRGQPWWSRLAFGDREAKSQRAIDAYSIYAADREEKEAADMRAARSMARLRAKEKRSFLTRREAQELKALQTRYLGPSSYEPSVSEWGRKNKPLLGKWNSLRERLWDTFSGPAASPSKSAAGGGMDVNVWGDLCWRVLFGFTMARDLRVAPTQDARQRQVDIVRTCCALVPCALCRDSAALFVDHLDLDKPDHPVGAAVWADF